MPRLVGLLLTLAAVCFADEDPREIVRRSVAQRNWERARDYTYFRRTQVFERTGGARKPKEDETHEILYLFGEPYERLVRKDGRPLSAKDEKKEQEKIDSLTAKRERESPAKRDARNARRQEDHEKDWRFLQEIPEAYDFRLAGVESVSGHPAWMIDATPRAGYRSKAARAGMLAKFQGRLWIDQSDYQWVKLDARIVDTVSIGLFLARLNKGTRLRMELTRVNDEVWLPRLVNIDIDARLALLKKLSADVELTFDNYRKFQAESRVVSTSELP
jgi:hypothetical protein